MNFTFVHGWGMDSSVWGDITTYFPKESCSFVDLGFVGSKTNESPSPPDKKTIYITHSLGTLWALQHHAPAIHALIAINGFTNFTNFVEERTLRAMQKGLHRNSSAQMKSFWRNCDLPHNPDQKLHTQRLHDGLDWLINWDVSEKLRALSVPVLSLYGAQDPLLDFKRMQKEWSGFTHKTMKDGGHILPLSHAAWCAQNIKDFIRELEA